MLRHFTHLKLKGGWEMSNNDAAYILGIDPGPESCGYAVVGKGGEYLRGGEASLEYLTGVVFTSRCSVAIETMAPRGQPTGHNIIDTAMVIGRLWQAAVDRGLDVYRVPRQNYMQRICGTHKGGDAALRRALKLRGAPDSMLRAGSHVRAAYAVALYVVDAERLALRLKGTWPAAGR